MNIGDTHRELHRQRMNASEELCKWRVVAASVRGTSHEKVGQLCQDAHQWEKLPKDVLVAAVADGAGSATLGKVGAIVAAQTAVETIRTNLGPILPEGEQGWQLLLSSAFEAAKAAVEAEAIACSMTARDLATTLIIVIATANLIAAAQVGDGVAVASDAEGNVVALTSPQRGEYANETTFLVSPNALEAVQTNLWRGATANIAVLSDGLQMLALEMASSKPHTPFFSPLFHFMAGVTDEAEAKKQLVAFLRSPRILERTDDDLTLLLATLA